MGGFGWEGEEDNGPDGATGRRGRRQSRYSAGGLINAIAVRWRTNLGSFG